MIQLQVSPFHIETMLTAMWGAPFSCIISNTTLVCVLFVPPSLHFFTKCLFDKLCALLDNWARELEVWCPQFRVLMYLGKVQYVTSAILMMSDNNIAMTVLQAVGLKGQKFAVECYTIMKSMMLSFQRLFP